MAAMFPNTEGDISALTRDGFVTFIAETRKDIQYLAKAIDGLKDTVQEMVDRFEADADDLRKSLGGLTELRNGHGDLGRRIADMEARQVKAEVRAEKAESRIAELETWRTTEKAWLAALGFVSGILGSIGGFFISKLWK